MNEFHLYQIIFDFFNNENIYKWTGNAIPNIYCQKYKKYYFGKHLLIYFIENTLNGACKNSI